MKKVCSWCGADRGGESESGRVTHGICPPCAENMRAELRWRRAVETIERELAAFAARQQEAA